MERDTLVGAVAVVLILGGAILYAALKPLPATAPGTVAAPSLPAGQYSEHAPYYDVVANYATSTPLSGPANAAAVSLMQKFVSDTIVQFKVDGNFAHLTPADITAMGFDQGRKETLNIVYLVGSSTHTVSYIYTVYEDTLGAHGNTTFKTFTFDTSSGAALSLSDIFLPNSAYLDMLSSISRTELVKNMAPYGDTAEIAAGTTPVDTNFQDFFFDNRDFVLLFPPYQVGPYAAGPQTVRIPLSELTNILKPQYR